MFLDGARPGEPMPTLTYVDPGIGQLSDSVRTSTPTPVSKAFAKFAFIYAGPRAAFFPKAETIFRGVSTIGPESFLAARPVLHFACSWEAKRYETLNDNDLEFLNHAKQCFAGEHFESTFKKWQTGQITEKELIVEIENRSARRQEIQFQTCLLPRDYSSFGQNSKVTGKPCGKRFSSRFSLRFSAPANPKARKENEMREPKPKRDTGKNAERAGATPPDGPLRGPGPSGSGGRSRPFFISLKVCPRPRIVQKQT